MARQLTFDLPVRTALGRGDFFVSEANAKAVARLEDTAGWPNNKLALVGPEGAGKTHLVQVWVSTHGADILTAGELEAENVQSVSKPVAVEDADRLKPQGEEALLHLHNFAAERGVPLLLTAREAPARWRIDLPDLKSRMDATDVVRIAAPDDALLSAVLVKLFADRQLQVKPALIAWLTTRMERSFAAADRLVADLDDAALTEGKAITRGLAQKVLDATA